MAYHAMTPARRAALRKAQLASAAKRRRGGVGAAAKRAVRQKAAYGVASANVATRRHVGSKGFKKGVKKGLKYTAVGLGAAAVVAAGASGASQTKTGKKYRKIYSASRNVNGFNRRKSMGNVGYAAQSNARRNAKRHIGNAKYGVARNVRYVGKHKNKARGMVSLARGGNRLYAKKPTTARGVGRYGY